MKAKLQSQENIHCYLSGYTYHLDYEIPLLHFKGMTQLMMTYPNKLKLPSSSTRTAKARFQYGFNGFD